MTLRYLTGVLLLSLPAAWAVAGSDSDWLPANLDVRPAPTSEILEPGVTLPPRPEEQPAPPVAASAQELCRLGMCLRLGEEEVHAGIPMPLLQGVLDWSMPTSPSVARVTLLSVSVEPSGAKEPRR